MNDGPESTQYDKARHEEMRLRPNGMYGRLKFFVHGFAPPKPVCDKCDRLVSICEAFGCEK